MGVKLVGIYEAAAKEFGFMGRMKLAMLTKIASEQAAAVADAPETVRLFEDSLARLRKEKAAA